MFNVPRACFRQTEHQGHLKKDGAGAKDLKNVQGHKTRETINEAMLPVYVGLLVKTVSEPLKGSVG